LIEVSGQRHSSAPLPHGKNPVTSRIGGKAGPTVVHIALYFLGVEANGFCSSWSKAGVHRLKKSLGANSKSYEPEDWRSNFHTDYQQILGSTIKIM